MGGSMGSRQRFATVQDGAPVSSVSSRLPQNTSWVISPARGRPIPGTSHQRRTHSGRWPYWPLSIPVAIPISHSMSSYRATPLNLAGWRVMLRGWRVTYSLAVRKSQRLPSLGTCCEVSSLEMNAFPVMVFDGPFVPSSLGTCYEVSSLEMNAFLVRVFYDPCAHSSLGFSPSSSRKVGCPLDWESEPVIFSLAHPALQQCCYRYMELAAAVPLGASWWGSPKCQAPALNWYQTPWWLGSPPSITSPPPLGKLLPQWRDPYLVEYPSMDQPASPMVSFECGLQSWGVAQSIPWSGTEVLPPI